MAHKPMYSHIMWGKHKVYRRDGKWTAIQTGSWDQMAAALERRYADGWITLILPVGDRPSWPWSVRNPE